MLENSYVTMTCINVKKLMYLKLDPNKTLESEKHKEVTNSGSWWLSTLPHTKQKAGNKEHLT